MVEIIGVSVVLLTGVVVVEFTCIVVVEYAGAVVVVFTGVVAVVKAGVEVVVSETSVEFEDTMPVVNEVFVVIACEVVLVDGADDVLYVEVDTALGVLLWLNVVGSLVSDVAID